tara:strand:- start:639 stop:857 length:219 start_codon:yes stop_codon:yes gene_type:complete
MKVMTIMNRSMNIIDPPGGVGGGADCPLIWVACQNHRLKIFTLLGEDLKHIGENRHIWPGKDILGNIRNQCL